MCSAMINRTTAIAVNLRWRCSVALASLSTASISLSGTAVVKESRLNSSQNFRSASISRILYPIQGGLPADVVLGNATVCQMCHLVAYLKGIEPSPAFQSRESGYVVFSVAAATVEIDHWSQPSLRD